MPVPDQQFSSIASALTADRAFRWHVRRTHLAFSARRLAMAAFWVTAAGLALLLGYSVLTTAVTNLQTLGSS